LNLFESPGPAEFFTFEEAILLDVEKDEPNTPTGRVFARPGITYAFASSASQARFTLSQYRGSDA
jgi:hypothetical protein